MERIKIYKNNKIYLGFLIFFGFAFFVLGVIHLVNSLFSGFNPRFLGGDWSAVIFTFQGILFFLMGYFNLKNEKYFMEWDEEELRYLLPKSKSTESIRWADVRGITFNLFEIRIQLADAEKTLNLSNVQFKELKHIKTKFETISRNIDRNN